MAAGYYDFEIEQGADFTIELTSANGRMTLAQSDPNITLTLSATETTSLDFDNAVYDLEVVASGGEVTKIIRGNVKLIREITK